MLSPWVLLSCVVSMWKMFDVYQNGNFSFNETSLTCFPCNSNFIFSVLGSVNIKHTSKWYQA